MDFICIKWVSLSRFPACLSRCTDAFSHLDDSVEGFFQLSLGLDPFLFPPLLPQDPDSLKSGSICHNAGNEKLFYQLNLKPAAIQIYICTFLSLSNRDFNV